MTKTSAITEAGDPTWAGVVVQTLCVDWNRDSQSTPVAEIRWDNAGSGDGAANRTPFRVILLSPHGDGLRAVVAITATLPMAEVAALQVVAEITGDVMTGPALGLLTA